MCVQEEGREGFDPVLRKYFPEKSKSNSSNQRILFGGTWGDLKPYEKDVYFPSE